MPGVELHLALLYTYGVKTGKLTLEQWVDYVAPSPHIYWAFPAQG